MSTREPNAAAPEGSASLLADLESRQDELLRLLADLEARTEQALAALGVNVGPQASAPQTGPAAAASAARTTTGATAAPSVETHPSATSSPVAAAPKTSRRKAA